MKLGVCEAPANMPSGSAEWQTLSRQVREAQADLFLLNEMPFGTWISCGCEPDGAILSASRHEHEIGLEHLSELGAPVVLGTHPTFEDRCSVNQAFVWRADKGIDAVHTKQFFPNEEGYFEARWFQRGATHFELADLGGLKVGFLICTEVMFNEWARYYGRQGAHVIAVPRAVGRESLRRWKTAMSMAAIVSGCYVISSNRAGFSADGQEFGGCGWIFDPSGDLIAETSTESPVVTAEFDATAVAHAQQEYPCYVEDLPR